MAPGKPVHSFAAESGQLIGLPKQPLVGFEEKLAERLVPKPGKEPQPSRDLVTYPE